MNKSLKHSLYIGLALSMLTGIGISANHTNVNARSHDLDEVQSKNNYYSIVNRDRANPNARNSDEKEGLFDRYTYYAQPIFASGYEKGNRKNQRIDSYYIKKYHIKLNSSRHYPRRNRRRTTKQRTRRRSKRTIKQTRRRERYNRKYNKSSNHFKKPLKVDKANYHKNLSVWYARNTKRLYKHYGDTNYNYENGWVDSELDRLNTNKINNKLYRIGWISGAVYYNSRQSYNWGNSNDFKHAFKLYKQGLTYAKNSHKHEVYHNYENNKWTTHKIDVMLG